MRAQQKHLTPQRQTNKYNPPDSSAIQSHLCLQGSVDLTERREMDGPCNGGVPGEPFWRVIGSGLIYARETPDFTDGAAGLNKLPVSISSDTRSIIRENIQFMHWFELLLLLFEAVCIYLIARGNPLKSGVSSNVNSGIERASNFYNRIFLTILPVSFVPLLSKQRIYVVIRSKLHLIVSLQSRGEVGCLVTKGNL